MDSSLDGAGGVIRCEIGRMCCGLATSLVRSFVLHRCALADVDVATVDALEAASDELVHDVVNECGDIVEIALDPGFDGLDVRLVLAPASEERVRVFAPGAVAAAAFDELLVDGHEVRVAHHFDRGGRGG